MSLSWHNRLQILLGPQRVALGRLRRGHGGSIIASHAEACAPAGGGRAASAALEAGFTAFDCRGHVATLIVSNAFLRYQVVPWNEGVRRGAEQEAFVRLCFQRVYGEAVARWDLRASRERYGAAAIASALDSDLVAAVEDVARRNGVRVGSVQPYLMWAFNRWRKEIGARDFCLVLVENGHVCLALAAAGQWRSVRSVAVNGSELQTVVTELVERELCLAALDPAQVGIYLRAPGEHAFEFRRDALPRAVVLGETDRGAAGQAGDALFALAGT